MSDSEDDLMPHSVLSFQNGKRGINAQRSFINNTNITSFSFRNNNNMMTSTFNMPNFERQRYAASNFDQRSIYSRRETSPMSLRSMPDSRMRNFNHSYYHGAMSSQRSVINGRSRSPMSIRSIDSNASVSANDIALAFKIAKFNKYEFKLIKDAYNKYMKNRVRKRIEKRRNLKLFLKGSRRKSGDDSGEQGSDSSISSDDCRSTRSVIYKENLPQYNTNHLLKSDLSQFRTTIKESDMYKDCTEHFKQNSFRNMFAINSDPEKNLTIQDKPQNTSATLKDRFKKGFLLPSQRFNNKSIMKTANCESSYHSSINGNSVKNSCNRPNQNESVNTDSDKEEIFSEVTVRENQTHEISIQRKRMLENDDDINSERKRNKVAASLKNKNQGASFCNTTNSDFTFKKPQMPVRKSAANPKKDGKITENQSVPEVLIAKSAQPLIDGIETDLGEPHHHPQQQTSQNNKEIDFSLYHTRLHNGIEIENENNKTTTNSTSDVSMKPSFIKRKLFTQKLDMAENKNLSNDNFAMNSPQNKIYNECREKNKVRKLVSSQSCLSRDVLGDDNVLDLIHKIVPPDQINITNASNKKDSRRSNNDDDKWDVTSVISMCNNDDVSDTYTDEEIFKLPQNVAKKKNNEVNKTKDDNEINKIKETINDSNNKNNKVEKSNKNRYKYKTKEDIHTKPKFECKVVVEKLQPVNLNETEQNKTTQNKRTVSNCVRSFWDTDFESDIEDRITPSWQNKFQIDKEKHQALDKLSSFSQNLNKTTSRGTVLTVRSLQNKVLNNSISVRSDISQVSRKNVPDKYQEKKEENNNNSVCKNSKKKQKSEESEAKKDIPNISKPISCNTKNEAKNIDQNKTKSSTSKKERKKIDKSPPTQDKCNTSRESLRLKQKNEKNKLNNSITNDSNKKQQKPKEKIFNESANKQNQNKRSKETSNLNSNQFKKSASKNTLLQKTRVLTPRKVNAKKCLSPKNAESSMNVSNISSRSLRVRQKKTNLSFL